MISGPTGEESGEQRPVTIVGAFASAADVSCGATNLDGGATATQASTTATAIPKRAAEICHVERLAKIQCMNNIPGAAIAHA